MSPDSVFITDQSDDNGSSGNTVHLQSFKVSLFTGVKGRRCNNPHPIPLVSSDLWCIRFLPNHNSPIVTRTPTTSLGTTATVPILKQFWENTTKNKMSMTRKCSKHRSQTSSRHREEETQIPGTRQHGSTKHRKVPKDAQGDTKYRKVDNDTTRVFILVPQGRYYHKGV